MFFFNDYQYLYLEYLRIYIINHIKLPFKICGCPHFLAQVVGSFNRETNEMDLTDPKLLQEVPLFCGKSYDHFPLQNVAIFRGFKLGKGWHNIIWPKLEK